MHTIILSSTSHIFPLQTRLKIAIRHMCTLILLLNYYSSDDKPGTGIVFETRRFITAVQS